MKCRKCEAKLKEDTLICPECGTVQKVEKKGPHYNYGKDLMRLATTKITEDPYDEEYETNRFKNNNALVLFKNPKFIIINLAIIILELIALFIIKSDSLLMSYPIRIVVYILFLINSISYELVFYKAFKFPYYGLIPIYRILVLLDISNKESYHNKRTLLGIVTAYTIWYLLAQSPMYYFWFMFYKTFLAIITITSIILYIKMRIDVLGDLSSRLNAKPKERILAIVAPLIALAYYGVSKKYYYTKLEDKYF